MKNYFTKAFVCAGVMASALALNGIAVFAATTYTYTFGSANSSADNATDYFAVSGTVKTDYIQIGQDTPITFTTTTPNAKLSIKVQGDGKKALDFKLDGTKIGTSDSAGKNGDPSEWTNINIAEAGEHSVAQSGGSARYYYISVTEDKEESSEEVAATGVSVDKSSVSVYVGKNDTVKAEKQPAGTTDKLTWSSADESIATVSGGVITGVSAGTTTVTATLGSYTAEVAVTVNAIPVVAPSDASELTAATETKTYDILGAAQAVSAVDQTYPYVAGNLYFDGEILVAATEKGSGLYYQESKKTERADGTSETAGLRVKTAQDVIGVKLAPGATLTVPVASGGGSERYGFLAADANAANTDLTAGEGDKVTTDKLASTGAVDTLTYTNTDSADKIVYISATADSFIADIKVEVPAAKTAADTLTKLNETSDRDFLAIDKANTKSFVIHALTQNEADNGLTLTGINGTKVERVVKNAYKTIKLSDDSTVSVDNEILPKDTVALYSISFSKILTKNTNVFTWNEK